MATRINQNIRLLEIFTASKNLLFLIPIMVLFYRDKLGLTFGDFMIADVAFAATVVIFEVPSGWLSDIWHRKAVLSTANLARQITFIPLGIGGTSILSLTAWLSLASVALFFYIRKRK